MERAVEHPAPGTVQQLTRTARRAALALCAALLALPGGGAAQDQDLQSFTVPWFTTMGSQLVRDMTITWESAGRLSFRADNAILVLPGLHESPHRAMSAWDALTGRSQPLDTRRVFILGAGAPCGPGEAATGPAGIDPVTGKLRGEDFPELVVRDVVAVQKALIDQLGIKAIRAVIGVGFGGLQALEWRRRYPHMVGAAIAVGPAPEPAPDDTSCQADILRRHASDETPEWMTLETAAAALAAMPAP